MTIGNEYLTKTMLVNSLYRNQRLQSPLLNNLTTDTTNPFAAIFSQHLLEQGKQTGQSFTVPSFDPIIFMAMNNTSLSPTMPTSSTELLRFAQLDSGKINQVLEGKLEGMGDAFVKAGRKYNINPALLVAISQHETGNGKSRAAHEKNNIAGMMGSHGLKTYASVEESIMDMARNLSHNYLETGLTTIPQIGAKYAPVGASNDPNNLNNYWVTVVTKYFNRLRAS